MFLFLSGRSISDTKVAKIEITRGAAEASDSFGLVERSDVSLASAWAFGAVASPAIVVVISDQRMRMRMMNHRDVFWGSHSQCHATIAKIEIATRNTAESSYTFGHWSAGEAITATAWHFSSITKPRACQRTPLQEMRMPRVCYWLYTTVADATQT